MDDLAAELYEQYVNELSRYSESIINELSENTSNDVQNEVNTYIASRSQELKKRLEKDIRMVEKKVNESSFQYNSETLDKAKDKLQFSFKNIYQSAAQTIRSIINKI